MQKAGYISCSVLASNSLFRIAFYFEGTAIGSMEPCDDEYTYQRAKIVHITSNSGWHAVPSQRGLCVCVCVLGVGGVGYQGALFVRAKQSCSVNKD